MNIIQTKSKLSKIPIGFKLFAKEELQKKLYQMRVSLDPDTIYINVAHNTEILSESLTDSLLKKSIRESSLLNSESAELYSLPTSTLAKDQISGLSISNIRPYIDLLSINFTHSYEKHLTAFWETEKFPIPQELQEESKDVFLENLIATYSMSEKACEIDTLYPSVKQTIVSYFSVQLKALSVKHTFPHKIHIDFFDNTQEKNSLPFLSFNLIEFTLSCFFLHLFRSYLSPNENITIQLKEEQNILPIQLSKILTISDISTMKSKHQARLEQFWLKNSDHYRILVKFSYLKELLDQQESSYKLSEKNFSLACQAMGFKEEEIDGLIGYKKTSLQKISMNFLENQPALDHVEVSSFTCNNQTSFDILQIRNKTTNNLVLYVPGYTPPFTPAQDKRLLTHWIIHQAQSENLRTTIASHFSLNSRLLGIKLDAFLYEDFPKTEENIAPKVVKEDIFSFLAENQKTRIIADLCTDKSIIYSNPIPNSLSIDAAFFTPIAKTIEYIPHLLPNIYTTSNNLLKLFPHPHITASEFMREKLKEKFDVDLDPNKTFIGYFIPLNKPTAFEPGETLESRKLSRKRTQTLTEAALSNYRIGFTPFSSTTIVFKDPSGTGLDYPSKEQLVRILPKDIEEIIREADLDTLHKNKLFAFWNTQANRVNQFIKHRFLQQVLEEYQDQLLTEEDLEIILEVVFHSLSLEEGKAFSPNANVSMEILTINNCQSTDLCVFRKKDEEMIVLYVPGNQKAFFHCNNNQELFNLFYIEAKNDVQWQKSLLDHFCSDDQESILTCLKEKGTYPISTSPIEEGLFTAIQKNIQNRTYKDSNRLITSDKELLLKRICSISRAIGNTLFIPSLAFPFLNWITLAAFATEAAINVYIAKKGDTAAERHQAAIDAGFSSIGILVSAFLGFRSIRFSKNQTMLTKDNIRRSSTLTPLKKEPLLEDTFFGTTKSMQVWNIAASHHRYSYLDVKAWFLGEKFLLFTGKTDKADHLIISSHGWNAIGSGILPVPENTELIVLGPHGWRLSDPKTANIANNMVVPYGIITRSKAVAVAQNSANPSQFMTSTLPLHSKQIDAKILAGTRTPGHIKNYTITKYQKFGVDEESYIDIAKAVTSSRNLFTVDHIAPVDVLTVRNRIGRLDPTLKDLFQTLQNHGIQYKKITLSFCRNALPSDPIYVAPVFNI